MSDRIQEAVSTLMDGEADELAIRRLLAHKDYEAVRSHWASFHRQRRAIRKEDLRFEDMDVSRLVMSAIESEVEYLPRNQRAWLKPVASVAVAASVAAIVVLGAPKFNAVSSSNVQTASVSSSLDDAVSVARDGSVGDTTSIYFAGKDVSSPMVNVSLRMGDGMPVSYQRPLRLVDDNLVPDSNDIEFDGQLMLMSSGSHYNNLSRQPVLYNPNLLQTQLNFSIKH